MSVCTYEYIYICRCVHMNIYIYVCRCGSYQTTSDKGERLLQAQRKEAQSLMQFGHVLARLANLYPVKEERQTKDDESDDENKNRGKQCGRTNNVDMLTLTTTATAANEIGRAHVHYYRRACREMSRLSEEYKSITDLTEHALQETWRMQTLHLGAIEEAFRRVRAKADVVETLQAQAVAMHHDDNHYQYRHVDDDRDEGKRHGRLGRPRAQHDGHPHTIEIESLPREKEALAALTHSVSTQLEELEPARSLSVARSVLRSVEALVQFAAESRHVWQSAHEQLARVQYGSRSR
jgi:hypothetical protein